MDLSLNNIFRQGILNATQNRAVAGIVREHGMRLGAARFVAGETAEEALATLRELDRKGFKTNTTLLGEAIHDAEEVQSVVEAYGDMIDRIAAAELRTNISVKLTQLGLDISEDESFRNVARLAEQAERHGQFVRIDMEESARVNATLRTYRRLRAEGHDNVGTVLQAYLFRTRSDLATLLPLEPNLRLVKGAYLEPATVAYQRKRDVDINYVKLLRKSLTEGGYTAVATHDDRVIDHVINYTAKHGIGTDRFEFQMLYGVRQKLQEELLLSGYPVLIATPYGPEWYYYLMRRMAERPANFLFVLRQAISP
jgi:proline dehydrogenase